MRAGLDRNQVARVEFRPCLRVGDGAMTQAKGADGVTSPRIGALTVVVNAAERVARFYADVFGVEFEVADLEGHSIFTGDLGGLEFSLVPRELSDVQCAENKTHWDIFVEDLDAVIAAVERSEGKTNDRLVEDDEIRCIGVFDPDGNFMPVKQLK